jgi:uncharacterized protein YlbG (UPF0298 family)
MNRVNFSSDKYKRAVTMKTKRVKMKFFIDCFYEARAIDIDTISNNINSNNNNNNAIVPNPYLLSLFDQLVFTLTGFSGVDRVHLQRIIESAGGTYRSYLSRESHYLIAYCNTPDNKDKLTAARSWKTVKIVHEGWLHAMISSEGLANEEDYKLIDDENNNNNNNNNNNKIDDIINNNSNNHNHNNNNNNHNNINNNNNNINSIFNNPSKSARAPGPSSNAAAPAINHHNNINVNNNNNNNNNHDNNQDRKSGV